VLLDAIQKPISLVLQSLTNQELWQLVHSCYGEELGLTSDDEDYVSSTGMDEETAATLANSPLSMVRIKWKFIAQF
jgi:hypothetical protein